MSEIGEKKGKTVHVVSISDIAGGEIISSRDVGAPIIIDDITDTYQRFPGAGPAVDRASFAAFIKGFTEDLDVKRLLEFIRCEIWKKQFGYAVILKEGDSIQALHPKTYQQGFTITEVDDFGSPTKIQMQWKPSESAKDTPQTYDLAVDGKDGFYYFRSFRGLLGLRGLSCLLTLVDPLRTQSALYLQYMKHGEWQAINHPVAKIKDLNPTKYAQVKADLQAPDSDKAVIIDAESDFYYDGPMAGGSAWDPTAMLEYGDKIISRETGLLLSMLTGDAMGYLSASATTAAQWFDAIKQYQAIILPDYLPILIALGLTKKVNFNNPYEATLGEKAETTKVVREALEGIVPIQQLINVINSIWGFTDDEKLIPDPNYEKRIQMEMENANSQDEKDPESGRESN
ncbi:hypothetical protein LCGC14_2220120 [marine sediment metagenome]|uniref:Uncharacterized protein n=1 Tax=marine sediment metagenome TaxID=412755 RepID=A0A0F9DBC7_9ZZZZ